MDNIKYSEMREKFLKNKITEKEWKDFCTSFLFELLKSEEVKPIFERLAKSLTKI